MTAGAIGAAGSPFRAATAFASADLPRGADAAALTAARVSFGNATTVVVAGLALATAVHRAPREDAALLVDRAAPLPAALAVRPGTEHALPAAVGSLRAAHVFAALAARPAADPEVAVAALEAERGAGPQPIPGVEAAEPGGALTVLLAPRALRAAGI